MHSEIALPKNEISSTFSMRILRLNFEILIIQNRGKNESMVNDTCNASGLGSICSADHGQTRRPDKDGI